MSGLSNHKTLLERRLEKVRTEGRIAFVPFLVVGDPSPSGFLQLADALVESGADVLELGFPYSDPPADGPVIQAADERALAGGTSTQQAFDLVKEFRARHDCPVSLLVYFNLVLQTGAEAFYARARDAGIDAILVADVPLELSAPLVAAAHNHQIAPVFLASAVTSTDRARRLGEVCGGYVYAAARVGITGVQSTVEDSSLHGLVQLLRSSGIELPILAGFGLSTPAHIRSVRAAGANGAIVGSAIVKAMADRLPDIDAACRSVYELGRSLSSAAREVQSA